MWIPKWKRDRDKGIDSPMPTQIVSNEEFIPRPQNSQQKQVEALIGSLSEEKSKKLGMERRAFMASSMGLATAFLANNMVYAGGSFSQVSGYNLNNAAAFVASGPNYGQLVTSWNPNCNGSVTTIDVVNGNIWLSGAFTAVHGLHRNFVAVVDPGRVRGRVRR